MNMVSKLLLSGLAGSALLGAAEPTAKAPVTRAALFKNGYALIIREVASAPADAFLLDESVTPVHGTLWFAPGDGLTVTGVKRLGDVPNRNPFADLAATYEGMKVTVTLKSGDGLPPRIVTGTAAELAGETFADLSVLLAVNPDPVVRPWNGSGLPDGAFLRGDVPMTKEEVRSVSLSKLRLTEDAVVYDVGAGTGSVSVEAALLAWRGRVYAIERKEEGCSLIRENCRRLAASNVEVIAGSAPEALVTLPAPTHVFIGGSGGTMGETVRCILQKNPLARVVINAIALETLSQVLALSRELPLSNLEVVQIAAARTKEIGGYHMMNGGNPVFICSFGGLPWQVQD